MKKILAVLLIFVMLTSISAPLALAADGDDPATEKCLAWGDMDGDGKASSGDARLVLRQSVGLEDYPSEACRRCDIDKDDKISSSDARFVLRLSVGLEEYPLHELLPILGSDATCTENGMTAGQYCTICDKEIVPQEVIPAFGHTEVIDEAKAATCTESGLTEGKHCEVCGEVLVPQETVEALGHQPVTVTATATDVCQEAQVCQRCGEELSPELKHEYAANASISPEKGIACTRCGKTSIPSFNDLVNPLKTDPHTFRAFSTTETEISDPKFTGVMLLLKSAFEEEFKDNMGSETEYTLLREKTEINKETFEILDSDAVSLLTDADVSSTKMENVTGIDFLKSLPDTVTGSYGRTSDLTGIKAKTFGDVLKVTVNLKPERYSELASKGGVDGISRISSTLGSLVSSAMAEFSSLNEDFLKTKCDSLSTVAVTYYFDRETLAPIAAAYRLNMDIDQEMNLYITESGAASSRSTGSISFNIQTNVTDYFFFDAYFD